VAANNREFVSSGRRWGVFLGPLLFLAMLYWRPLPLGPGGNEVFAVTLWMVMWWITEAVPLAVTALLPIVLFTLTGVMKLEEALVPYSDKIIYLFFGGFMLALGLEEHGLHKRIALTILRLAGSSPRQLVFGFLTSTAMISMWISNTATAVMMLPMAMSLLDLLQRDETGDEPNAANSAFATALMLAIAYGANIGGMATIIGTPPNLVMRGFFADQLGIEISFFKWICWALPISLLLILTVYFVLVRWLYPCSSEPHAKAEELFQRERELMGPMTGAHWRMLTVFALTAALWMFRGLIKEFFPQLPLTDETIAVAAAIALFVIPGEAGSGGALLQWEATRKLPWGILLLFGGGLCLAQALEKTGLIDLLSGRVESFGQGEFWLTLILLTAAAIYLTELMSNVALVAVLVPVVIGIAQGMEVDPLLLAFPVTLASSCAFMLPMATPPNAIVFSSGKVTVMQMAKAGFWLNFIALVVIVLLSQGLLRLIK
jgi:solute carrier family 13 (sodium-dependent dicarboxylate transporter), member 2/3/5